MTLRFGVTVVVFEAMVTGVGDMAMNLGGLRVHLTVNRREWCFGEKWCFIVCLATFILDVTSRSCLWEKCFVGLGDAGVRACRSQTNRGLSRQPAGHWPVNPRTGQGTPDVVC